MAFIGSERGSEADQADDDDNDGIGVAEIKEAAAELRQQEENADGDYNDRAHQATNCATLAVATDAITHSSIVSRRSLLGLTFHAVHEHENADGNQDERPEFREAVPLKPLKIAEQEKDAYADQDDRTDWFFLAETVEGICQYLSGSLGLGGAQGVDGHVNPEGWSGDAMGGLPPRGFQTVCGG